MNIWISGTGGRLGSVLYVHLLQGGFSITSLNRTDLSPTARVGLVKLFDKSKPDYFIHLASNLTPRGSSAEKLLSDAMETLELDRYVYRFCGLHSIPLIYTSTYFIYSGRAEPWSESEFDFAEPFAFGDRQIYALVKAQVSREIVNRRRNGDPFSTIVIPNVIGGQLHSSGRRDHLAERALSLIIEAVLDQRKVIDAGQGDGRRLQFISPTELSTWLCWVLGAGIVLPELTHLASAEVFTPLDLFRSITRYLAIDLEVVGRDTDEVFSTTIDDSMARSALNWEGGKSLDSSVDQWLSTQKLDLLGIRTP